MSSIGIMQGRMTPSNGRGIQFFPFDNWKNEFKSVADVGLMEIEFIFDYDNYLCNPLWTDTGIEEIKGIIDETGTVVNSLCFDYFMRRPFYKANIQERDLIRNENKEILLMMFKSVDAIGANLIEMPSVDGSSLKSDEEKELYRLFLKEVLNETSEKYGHIRIGLETDLEITDFVEFIDSIESDRLGANYDSGNSSGLGYDLYNEVISLGKRIYNIHIKDRIYRGNTVELGTGSADFERLFQGLKEIGYGDGFIIQAARAKDGDEKKTITKQKRFIEEYLKRYEIG